MLQSFRQTSKAIPPRVVPKPANQHELMQMTLNRIMLDTLVALGVSKSDLMAQLREATSNLNMSENENAAFGLEMLSRQLKAA